MQVFVVAPNISSVQLGKQIGTTQKTAWYMLQRLKEVAPTDARLGSSTHEAYDAFVHAALHYPPLTICKRIDKKSQAV